MYIYQDSSLEDETTIIDREMAKCVKERQITVPQQIVEIEGLVLNQEPRDSDR